MVIVGVQMLNIDPAKMKCEPGESDKRLWISDRLIQMFFLGELTQLRKLLNPQPSIPNLTEPLHSIYASYPTRRQPRRVLKFQGYTEEGLMLTYLHVARYGYAGDTMWLAEPWTVDPKYDDLPVEELTPERGIVYRALQPEGFDDTEIRWRPAKVLRKIHARVRFRLLGMTVERLQDITPDDALASGVEDQWEHKGGVWSKSAALACRMEFAKMWDSQYSWRKGKPIWSKNPWVYRLEFKRPW